MKRFTQLGWPITLLLVGLLLAVVPPVYAQDGTARIETGPPVEPTIFDGDLRDLPLVRAWRPGDPIKEIPRREVRPPQVLNPAPPPLDEDPLLRIQEKERMSGLQKVFTSPDLNFAGQGFTGVNPPDTVGDVGTDFFIQAINGGGGSLFVIYNKSNGSVAAGPIALDSLGSGSCAGGAGDPVVVYDTLASRWVLAEFSGSGNNICVYVSQTGNPVTGGWFNYGFQAPNFPDYFKIGVWPDAYYVGSNENSPAIYALDRSRMLQGLSATFQRSTVPALGGFGFQVLTPSHLNGTATPATNTPNFFMRHRDDEAHNPGSNNPSADFVEIWEYNGGFDTGGSATLNGPINIAVAEFDSTLCGLTSFSCVPQPGTGTQLDPLREPVMFRLQYRNHGTHEALIGNFAVDVGSNRAGVRWFELRRTGGAWSLFQEGTFAPGSLHRWMGAIASDQDGNIALGYNFGSSSVAPGLRYVGRLTSDTLGTLPQGEVTLVNGTSANSSNRYGDYASMGVDPVDGCTFWFTGEYNTSSTWSTRIGSFSFDACGGGGGNTPPAVSITAPTTGSSFALGAPVSFSGTANDTQDGDLSSSLSWTSSLDGTIGSGAAFSTSSLSAGSHTITASVTDSGSLSGSDQISITISTGGGPCSGCIDWNSTATVSYSNQDSSGNVAAQDAGATLFLQDNTWRRTTQTFNVTANTVIEVEFQSTQEGEIHGIGFDENDTLTDATRIFQLHGTQTWGSAFQDFNNYVAGSGFVTYQIPVGQFYTGGAMFLVLVNDNDAGSGNNSSFRNVRIFESGPVNTAPTVAITAPANGASSTVGDSVTFSGTATDAEDGNIAGNLSWTSSLDGAIGNGASFSTSGLSVGSHTITAAVTDSGGLSDSDQVSITVNPAGGGCTDCIDWNSTGTVSYSNQDASGNVSVQDGGDTLFLQDNTWRRTTQTFNVTANTVIEVEFQSTQEGEIHGIGFDENDTLTDATRIFQLHGTQTWGSAFQDFNNYVAGSGFVTYQIPVGQFYTGSAMFLVLVNDNDAGSGNNSSFRNVRVFEDTSGGGCAADVDFSGGAAGWTNSGASTCTTGSFVIGTPTQITNSGVVTQVGGDHTTGSGNAFFSATNSSAGVNDVDGGNCIVTSPVYAVTEASNVSVWYFHGQRDAGDDASGDFFLLEISTNGGSTWSSLASFGDVQVNAAWTEATTTVSAGDNVQFRVQVSDGAGPGDLIEAGIDDISICP